MLTLKELKKDLKERVLKDDIVKAILFSYQKSNGEQIPKSHAKIQNAFFTMKVKNPIIFKSFIFDRSGIVPFSDELDSILFRLEASGILAAENPAYETYTHLKHTDVLEESYLKFDEDQKNYINYSASIFSELMK